MAVKNPPKGCLACNTEEAREFIISKGANPDAIFTRDKIKEQPEDSIIIAMQPCEDCGAELFINPETCFLPSVLPN